MQSIDRKRFIKFGLLGMVALGVIACEPGVEFGNLGFKSSYSVARDALEDGRYSVANRHYVQLLKSAGPHTPRIRLEYAHSLLREGQFEAASGQAQALASSQTGAARGAALAVFGASEHERALADIDLGVSRDRVVLRLKSAQTAINEVLEKSPEMDPLGGLSSRAKSIEATLKTLG